MTGKSLDPVTYDNQGNIIPLEERFNEEKDDIRYSLAKGAKEAVHRTVTDITDVGEILLTDSSPSIMTSQRGVRNLPMVMNASHVRSNVLTAEEAKKLGLSTKNTHFHGLGEQMLLDVMDGLSAVEYAYRGTPNAENPSRRENYFLLISKIKDQNGDTINIPVYIDEKAQHNNVFIDANKVATVFGRSVFAEYIKRHVEKGNLVRIKNRSTFASEPTGLIPARYSASASAEKKIPQSGDVVNTPGENNFTDNRESRRGTAELVEQYGKIPEGERPFRDVEVLERTSRNRRVSQTVRTVLEAEATPDTLVPSIEEMVADGDFSYETYTDDQAMEDAQASIKRKGYATALADWINSVRKGQVSKANTTMGWELYRNAAESVRSTRPLQVPFLA